MYREVAQQQEAYTWQVLYEDGTWLTEYDAERTDGRGWAEVEHSRVRGIQLVPNGGQGHVHGVALPPGAEPIYFRRSAITINPAEEKSQDAVLYCRCIGWRKGSEGIFLFVFEDNTTLLTTDFLAI